MCEALGVRPAERQSTVKVRMSSVREVVIPRNRGFFQSPQGVLRRPATAIMGERTHFQDVIDVSSADPQKAGIKPISFVRQVLAVCLCPELLHVDSFPLDARQRARKLLEACAGGSVGSYTDSSGLPCVQQSIAEFITRRDKGVPTDPQNIFITAGSQRAITVMVKLLSGGKGVSQTGVLTPRPCPATLPRLLDKVGARLVPYPLKEQSGWAVDMEGLQSALTAARGHCHPKAMYISNPGNPTGHVQSRESIEEVIRFAAEERLFLLVDEVYQDSVYGEDQGFESYKRVLFNMDKQYYETVELASFHSLSNGIVGECGLRAGYMELVNVDPVVMTFAETQLCTDISTPVTGQIALELMVNPPRPGDPSYGTHTQEIASNHATVCRNSKRAWQLLNDLPGMSCKPVAGGVYVYPSLTLPQELVKRARMMELEPDVLYCQMLQEEEGVRLGAGGEEGRGEGTYHLRVSVLTPCNTFEEVLARLVAFHLRLLKEFPLLG
ncbi:alanine aminotransferase 2-like [Aplochiton taeniatus]